MCSNLKLLDTVALQNRLTVNHAIVSSQFNRYCIVVEDGLYVLQLCGLMDNISPTTSLKKVFVKLPNFVPSSHLEIDINSFIIQLPQFELYEAVLRLDISEELNNGLPIKQQQPVLAKWSPSGLISNRHSVIASLSNTGSLNIMVRTINEVELEEYICIANITKLGIDLVKSSWSSLKKCSPSSQLDELKRRAEQILPTSFTWSHLITCADNRQFSLLIVGHLSGEINVWRIDSRNANDVSDSGVSFISSYKTELKKITALHWQQSGNNGLVIIGDIKGKVKTVCIKDINLDSVTFENEICLWNEADDLRIDHFNVFIYERMLYIITVKGSVLLVCLINESGKIVDIHSFPAGNFQITGVHHLEDNVFLILTYTGVLKELKLSCVSNKLQIEWRPLYIDFKWSHYRTHGLIVSPNKVFIGILVGSSRINDIRRSKDHIRLLILKNMVKNPLDVLMKNKMDSLADYWDCLEILRISGLIEKKLPCDGLPAGLNYDRLTLIQLKTCFWLAKASETMYDRMNTLEKYNILRCDEFKFIIKIKLAIDHMHHLLALLADDKELADFHMQSLDIINMYLKEIIATDRIPNLGLGKHTIDELYDVISIANQLKYPPSPRCIWCKENIIGISCVPPHVDTRCNMSLMPIVKLPYYKCQFCECIVHHKLREIYSVVVCPYCDVPLDFVSFLTGSNNDNSSRISVTVQKEKDNFDTSCCSSDCDKEVVSVDTIDDHAFTNIDAERDGINLVWISSSDEDDNKTEDVVMKTE